MNNQRPQSNTCEMWMNTVSVCWFEDVAEHKSLSESYQEQWWTCCVANLTRWTCKPRTFSSFNSQIWQCGRCSQQARWDEEPERSLAPSQENVLECFCKNSWPQRCRDEQWGQIMEIPTMWTFNCFQRQLAVKREHLTSSPFTNASLLWEHYPLLVFPSLLYIIKWPTACSLQQTIEPALFFHPQIYWFMLHHPQAAWPCSPVQLQWSWANQYGSDANSVLHVISAQNKVRHARLETLPLMETAFQMAPSVAASNNDSVQKMPTFKESWYSFRREIIYDLNQKP